MWNYWVVLQYLAEFFIEFEMFQTKVIEKIKTHILCSVTFFFENLAVNGIMWNNTADPDRPHDNMARAHCMLDN